MIITKNTTETSLINVTDNKEGIDTIQFRVRYQETDQMGVAYHGNYFTWFEMGRTELLRGVTGKSYQELEDTNVLMAIIKAECSYKKPAKYDDILTLKTQIVQITGVRLEHEYHLYRNDELLAVGHTTLATIDHQGRIVPVPGWLRALAPKSEKKK